MDDPKIDDPQQGNTSPPQGGGEVRIAKREGRGRRTVLIYKTLALVLVSGAMLYFVTMHRPTSNSEQDAAETNASDASTDANARSDTSNASTDAANAPRRALTARPVQPTQDGEDQSRDLSDYAVPGQPAPSVAEVIDRLHAAGIYSGIGAFSPPGTSPPLVGLAVPDDFPLPEGYVRHSQTTDDGQSIEAILMFSPDFQFFDASGRPLQIPENRVVPPELAPPGLAIRPIKIPRPLEPRSPSP
jgi:hypothetical protein